MARLEARRSFNTRFGRPQTARDRTNTKSAMARGEGLAGGVRRRARRSKVGALTSAQSEKYPGSGTAVGRGVGSGAPDTGQLYDS